MRIESVGQSNRNFHPASVSQAQQAETTRPPARGRAAALPETFTTATRSDSSGSTAAIAESPNGKVRGVVRLLESGHFSGVADVRLRINFFEELNARRQAAAGPIVTEEARALLGEVQQGLDEFVSSLDLTPEQQEALAGAAETFESVVNGAVEQFASGGSFDVEALADSVQSAFDVLVQELFDSSAAADPTAPVVEPVIAEDEAPAESADPLDAGLTALSETFADALAGFLDAANAAVQLPDPSPSSGHGAAYDKFLGIYDELRGVAVEEVG